MDYRSLKANEKAPRGTGFYVQVGHRYYGGQALDKEEVQVSTDPPFTSFFDKHGKRTPGYNARHYREYHVGWWSRGNRAARDRRKGTEAEYRKPVDRPRKKTVVQLTGGTTAQLVDDVKDAKVFRTKEQVERACALLQNLYGTTGAKVSVHYKGDTQ